MGVKKERRLRVYENRVMGEYLGLRARESGEHYLTRSVMIHTSPNTIWVIK
jgi:hypothetical protein